MEEARRLKRLPPYLFTVIDNLKREVSERGIDVVDLSMGSPDIPPPPHVNRALTEALKDNENHRYSKFDNHVEKDFRNAISNWYKQRFNIDLDPNTEVLPLIGSKEGIAHLSLTFLNNDDLALVPSPAYPVHFNGVIMAGGILYNVPLREENGYLPDVHNLSSESVRLSKLFFLSYPHNPTAATCDLGFYEKVTSWAKDKNIIVVSDLAYSDFTFNGQRAPSLLEAKGARDFSIEFHTLSKSYGMAGWRIGFVVGNRKILSSLAKTKSYVDFGLFRAVQAAATAALTGPQDSVKEAVQEYKKRVGYFCKGLNDIGWEVKTPEATFYVWARIPLKFSALTSLEFSELMLKEVGVAAAPGTGFGEYGEGYVRFAMVQPVERLKIAIERIKKLLEISG